MKASKLLIIANLVLWASIFIVLIPQAIDKQLSNSDRVIINHKLNIGE